MKEKDMPIAEDNGNIKIILVDRSVKMSNWYIVKNGEILYTVDTDEEVQEIMEQDITGELEAYPKEAYLRKDVKSLGR